jgi:hypothetical protein
MKPTDPPPPDDRAPARQAPPPLQGQAQDPHESHEYGPDDLHNEGVAHEHSDVDVKAILSFAAIVTVVSIVCGFVVWGMFGFFERQAAGRDPQMSPLAVPATQMPPTTTGAFAFGGAQQHQPQLLTNEPAALRQHRQEEDAQLQRYGWVNQSGGVARVPIADAKKLIVERGLASRPGGTDPLLGTYGQARGEAAGGRSIPTRAQAPAGPDAAAPPAAPPAPKEEPPAHAPSGRGGGA